MRSLQHRRTGWRRFVFSKVIASLLFIFALYMGTVVWGMYGRYKETHEKMVASATKFEEVKVQRQDLQEKVSNLQSKSGKEAALREKFMVAKDGEQVLVLVDDNRAASSSGEMSGKSGWWREFLSWF